MNLIALSDSDLSELAQACLHAIKQHDAGILERKPFDSVAIIELRAIVLRLFHLGTRCFRTNRYVYFTHDGRDVLVFVLGSGQQNFCVPLADWTITTEEVVECRVEEGAGLLSEESTETLRHWCALIP